MPNQKPLAGKRGVLPLVAGGLAFILSLSCTSGAQTPPQPVRPPAPSARPAPKHEQALRAIYKELVEINTTHSKGSATQAAQAMGARLTAAGFRAEDVKVLVHPENATKGNLVAQIRPARTRMCDDRKMSSEHGAARTTTDLPLHEQLDRLDQNGYVILQGVLSAQEIDALVAALEPFERDRPMGRNDFEGERTQRVYSLAAKHEVFMRLAEHPAIMAILEQRLLKNWLLSTIQSIRLHPGETAQAWHADDMFYLVPRPSPLLAISTIWAIEPFTAENGATQVIPGSHRWGAEHPDEREQTAVTAVMPAGSVLVFSAALWHRGGANRSTGTRLCISPQYCQPWLRPQESQLLIAPPDVAARYSDRARSMLGYSIHPPFIGQVDGMHPLRLIDPSYREHKTDAREVADQVLPGSRVSRQHL